VAKDQNNPKYSLQRANNASSRIKKEKEIFQQIMILTLSARRLIISYLLNFIYFHYTTTSGENSPCLCIFLFLWGFAPVLDFGLSTRVDKISLNYILTKKLVVRLFFLTKTSGENVQPHI
jgi:hypothetical protein